MARTPRLIFALTITSALCSVRVARAGDNAAAAEALFREAKTLTEQDRWREACPKFEASYKLDRTLGTLMNLADCHEHVGRVATAWAEWNEALELARRAGDERVGFATQRRDALTGRLPKLTVEVKNPVAGLAVYRDEGKVEPGAYNLALPVDPGAHVVSVRREGQVLEQKSVDASEGQTSSVSFDLAAIDKAHPPPVEPPPTAPGGGPADRAPEPSSQKTIGFVVGGVGVAAVVTGAVFGVLAITQKNKAEEPDACVNNFCSNKGLDAAEKSRNYANIGQWVGIGGVVLTAVGATLVLTAPSSSAHSGRRVIAAPWIAPGSGGLSVSGAL